MMMSDDKVGGWVKKGQNHDDVILECPPIAYVTLAVCERVHNGHRSIFVVVHAGPSPAEGLGGLNPPCILKISSPYLDQGEHIIPTH